LQPAAHLECLGVGLGGQLPPTRQLAQQFEQLEVWPRPGLALMHRRFDHGHAAFPDGVAQRRLELAEGRLALGDAAEVVLVEVEQQGHAHAGYSSAAASAR
jgi:hypothetical protein